MQTNILIVDDDFLFCEALRATMEGEGYQVHVASSLEHARNLLKNEVFSVVFIDVYLPDGNGIDLLSGLALLPESPEAIVVTALGDPDGAESAIAGGAWDYVQKPANMDDIVLMVRRAVASHQRKHKRLRQFGISGIICKSLPMRLCLLQMFEAAQTDTPVLITGETGTGKELVARAVHSNSRRSKGPFVVVDCGALSPTLQESELFGNVRGAFTGAAQSRQGLVLMADGGSLFLDEVGELSPEQQKVFLRVLQERSFRPVGGTGEIQSDFRVVAATNRNLAAMAEEGSFRSDLLYRLQGSVISLPPLRARGEDIELLAEHALAESLKRYDRGEKHFSSEALQAMASYPWSGNVRELLHTVEQAVLTSQEDPVILLQHLPLQLRTSAARTRLEEQNIQSGGKGGEQARGVRGRSLRSPEEPLTEYDAALPAPEGQARPEHQTPPLSWREFQEQELFEHKRQYLLSLLHWADGNIPRAAKRAGLSRQRLYTLLRDHGIARQWNEEKEPWRRAHAAGG